MTLAIRRQSGFAVRMSEIFELRWDWIDFPNRRIVWPNSQTDGFSKPVGEQGLSLLTMAPRFAGSLFVGPSVSKPSCRLPGNIHYQGWKRVLSRASVPHVGTYRVWHRAATDIANSGGPVKAGVALTANKTATLFMWFAAHGGRSDTQRGRDPVAARRDGTVQEWRMPAAAAVLPHCGLEIEMPATGAAVA